LSAIGGLIEADMKLGNVNDEIGISFRVHRASRGPASSDQRPGHDPQSERAKPTSSENQAAPRTVSSLSTSDPTEQAMLQNLVYEAFLGVPNRLSRLSSQQIPQRPPALEPIDRARVGIAASEGPHEQRGASCKKIYPATAMPFALSPISVPDTLRQPTARPWRRLRPPPAAERTATGRCGRGGSFPIFLGTAGKTLREARCWTDQSVLR